MNGSTKAVFRRFQHSWAVNFEVSVLVERVDPLFDFKDGRSRPVRIAWVSHIRNQPGFWRPNSSYQDGGRSVSPEEGSKNRIELGIFGCFPARHSAMMW